MLYEMLHSFGHLVVSCCIVLYIVVWSLIAMKLFYQTNVVRYNISFVFWDVVWCCTRLATPYDFVVFCCTRATKTRANSFWQTLCTKCCVRLATPLFNTIEQHATMCNQCCMMFYELLYSFGRGFISTYVGNTKKSKVPWRCRLFKGEYQIWGAKNLIIVSGLLQVIKRFVCPPQGVDVSIR